MTMRQSMHITQRLELKLQPRQILCNELLQLPLLDLQVRLQAELEENICIEAVDRPESMSSLPEMQPVAQMTPPGGDGETMTNGEEGAQEPGRMQELFQYLSNSRTSVSPSGGDVPEAYDVEGRVSLHNSWRYGLTEALRLEKMPDDVEAVAEYIAGCLDDRGYLHESIQEIAMETGADILVVEEALETLQRVAPAGVGARNLQERLLLQAHGLQDRNLVLEKILSNCFDDLLHFKKDAICKKLGISREDFRDAVEELRNLIKESLPLEDGEPSAGVVPDATISLGPDGWKVQLHDEAIPKLRLSAYANKLANSNAKLSPENEEYLKRALNRAKWMMDALDQRRKTLRGILQEVVKKQERFFDFGVKQLVPLRQEEVAESLSLHASTVSRAVQDKFVETPHGVFPLKIFFPRGVDKTTGGDQASRDSVQEALVALVANENMETPLSDDELVELLKKKGYSISRRTVCKYRDERGIPPTSKRRNLKRMALNRHSA